MSATGVAVRAVHSVSRRAVAPMLVRLLLLGVVFFAVAGTALIVVADAAVDWTGFETADVVVFLLTFPALPVMGALLATRRPANPIGWLFLAAALGLAISAFAHGYGDYAIDARPDALPGAGLVTSWGWTGWVAFGLLAVFVPLLFPTGRLPSARWRPVAVVGGVAVAALTLTLALRPGPLEDFHTHNPLGSPVLVGVLDGLEALARPALLLVLLAGLVSLAVRYRSGDATLRGQIKWLGYATGVLVAVDVIGNLALGGGLDNHPAICTWGTTATKPVYGMVVPALLYTGVPVAVAVAVLRHHLFDIDRLIRRSAVYLMLWAAIAVLYSGVAVALGVAVSGRLPVAAGVLVTMAFTVAFQPARRSLERLADRWAFGRRPSDYELASGFGATSGTGEGLEGLAGSLAEILRRGLALAWARVILEPAGGGGPVMAVAPDGEPGPERAHLTVPVTHGGTALGRIECGPPLDSRRPSERRALLDLLAHEAGLAVHNLVLAQALTEQVRTVDAQAAELVASRARIVLAQDAERRRVERDIHDGAQQELVAMIAKLRVARELVGRDPQSAVATLEELQGDAQAALRGIRELAQGIHPSVLADQGLVAAVEDRSARLPLEVVVVADDATRNRRFPDPVEAAAFFVVSEALANVLKHAGAGRATVAFSGRDGSLVVEVRDDGRGFDPGDHEGSGLTHLADRVGALGGRLEVHSAPGAGATVTATLPTGE
ncbi:MAG: sensor histidine kinase [Acidimicrobiia bacterium]